MGICKTEEAIEDFKQGKMIILADDEDRENEGDLTIAAEFYGEIRSRAYLFADDE